MERMKLKRGPVGIPLEEEKKKMIEEIMQKEHLSIPMMAKRIGLTKIRLRYPVFLGGNCSLESYRKITRYLDRQSVKAAQE